MKRLIIFGILAVVAYVALHHYQVPPQAARGAAPSARAHQLHCHAPVTTTAARVGASIKGPAPLGHPLLAGRSYNLPPVTISNQGSGAETLTLRIQRLSRGCGRTIRPSWVSGTGHSVTLDPGEAATVPLVLHVPGNASGRYRTDVAVYAMAGSGSAPGGSASLAAGAADPVIITVRRPS